jgi:D-3-phosphoglycerate dehydrogenase / 2-oxoglutarate reductase
MGRPKILVTPRSLTLDGDASLGLLEHAGYEPVFCSRGRMPEEEELLHLLPGCVGWIAGVEKISERVLAAANGLKAISRNGTGVDSIDLSACRKLGIRVLTADGANARGVAELAVSLLLSLARSVPFSDAVLKAGRWERTLGTELEGKTLGVVGCGRIGKLVARICIALGMTVIAHDARPDESFAPSPSFRFAGREAVLQESNCVSLHCPHTPGDEPLVNTGALKAMRRGVLLVNTARAGLVDPEAVLAALEEGRLGGYATDVFPEEPPTFQPLHAHRKVVLTPHLGGYTAESVGRATRMAVDNLIRALGEATETHTRAAL